MWSALGTTSAERCQGTKKRKQGLSRALASPALPPVSHVPAPLVATQADAQFDLLLVARLAIFDAASAWGEALRMFKRMQVRGGGGGPGALGGGCWR